LLACRTWSCNPVASAAARERSAAGSAREGTAGLTKRAMLVAEGRSSCSNCSRFGTTSRFRLVTPVTLPPGRLRLCDKSKSARIGPYPEDNWNASCRLLRDQCRSSAAGGNKYCHLLMNQLCRKLWQTTAVRLRPAIFDADVLPLYIPNRP